MNRKRSGIALLITIILIFFGVYFYQLYDRGVEIVPPQDNSQNQNQDQDNAASTTPENKGNDGENRVIIETVLEEEGSMEESANSYWWLNSGAQLTFSNGIMKTIQGPLSVVSPWRMHYGNVNPIDTDGGYHPQNIFRLATILKWQNFEQEVCVKINRYNLSASPNRNESNGILLLNHYENQNNLYYTGIRVDGYAIIKKKSMGEYYEMDYRPLLIGNLANYDKIKNPNILPENRWIGLKSIVRKTPEGDISIKFFTDMNCAGNWVLSAEALDNGVDFGKIVMDNPSHAGIRTDFMDVEFKSYLIREINP